MEKARALVDKELALLRDLLSADVAAVAWQQKADSRMVWRAASGCSDERYRSLSIRTGRGIEGTAARIGRALALNGEDPDTQRMRRESPLMLVEGLQSAAAQPILSGTTVLGVLMAGNRSARAYSDENLLVLQLSSRWLGQLIEMADSEDWVHFRTQS